MKKMYSEKERLDMIVQANLKHKILETYTDTVSNPILDEDGNITGYTEPVEVENIRLIDNPDEPERIAKLSMTPLDFLKALDKIGISYETVKQIMEANPEVDREMRFCQRVYRGHPMINQFAQQFNVSEETLDHIFKVANGEEE